jgi:23S rRNA pseudouridine1911/1915/1917 synthase
MLIEEIIPAALAGDRVDRVVALLADISRAQSSALIAAGGVSVDGSLATSGKVRLEEGQELSIDPTMVPEKELPQPDSSVAVEVVFADEHVVVVNKAAGVVVHPGAGNPTGTLVNGLLALYPEIASVGQLMRPGIVHRLDIGTTGLMVAARTNEAYEGLVDALSQRLVHREYMAVAVGHFDAPAGVIDASIGRDVRDIMKMAVRVDGKFARTHYEVVAAYDEPISASLVRCTLETGRTHQIRVHLAAVGHPVVGDVMYGGVRAGAPFRRPALHAALLSFEHPVGGEQMSFEAPLPADFTELLSRFSGAGG